MAIKKLKVTEDNTVEKEEAKEEFLSEDEIEKAVSKGQDEIEKIEMLVKLMIGAFSEMTFGRELLGMDSSKEFFSNALFSCEELYPRILNGEIEPILKKDIEESTKEKALKEMEDTRTKIFEELLKNK